MKFNCDYFKLLKERKRKKQEDDLVKQVIYERSWHQWFAWYPVRTARGECRWLETVERRNSVHDHVLEGEIRLYLDTSWFQMSYMYNYNYRALSPSVQHNPDKNI